MKDRDTGRISGFLNYDEDKMKTRGCDDPLYEREFFYLLWRRASGMSGSGNDQPKRAPGCTWSDKDNASDGMNSNNGNSQDKSEIDISQGKSGTDASQDESGLLQLRRPAARYRKTSLVHRTSRKMMSLQYIIIIEKRYR